MRWYETVPTNRYILNACRRVKAKKKFCNKGEGKRNAASLKNKKNSQLLY